MSTRAEVHEDVMICAIEWFDDLRGDGSIDNYEFADWLLRSPAHIDAFLTIAAMHGGLSAVTREDRLWLESLLADGADNVRPINGTVVNLPVEQASVAGGVEVPARRWRPWALVASAMALALLAVSAVMHAYWQADPAVYYATEIGEQRAVVLDDGSIVHLNTDSRVAIRFDDAARNIRLLRGEAIFDVKKDPGRPFRVTSDSATVEAIGTRFNVYNQEEKTVVTVIEGRVAVEPVVEKSLARDGVGAIASIQTGVATEVTSRNAVEVAVGEQLSMTRDGAVGNVPIPIDTTRATAWTQRRVIFDNDALETVVAEFNRYNRTKLVLRDPELRQRRISGVFTVDDPEALVLILETMTPLRTIERGQHVIEIALRKTG